MLHGKEVGGFYVEVQVCSDNLRCVLAMYMSEVLFCDRILTCCVILKWPFRWEIIWLQKHQSGRDSYLADSWPALRSRCCFLYQSCIRFLTIP